MKILPYLLLILAITSGQLSKLPIGSGGITILDLVVFFLCMAGLVTLKFKLKKPPLFVTAALFFIPVAILSLVLTPLYLQAGEYLISFFYTVRFSAYLFLGWIIYSGAYQNLNTNKTLIIAGVILALLGLIQIVFLPDLQFLSKFGWDPHYFRAVSTFLDPNFLGSFLVLTLLLLAKKPRLLFALVYICLIFTFSRGAYIAFLASFLILSLLKRSLKLAALTIILFTLLLVSYYSYKKDVAAPRGVSREKSAAARISSWQQGGALFQIKPFLGVGFNAYRYGIREYSLGDNSFLKSQGSTTNDSSLVHIAATTGILGLFAYLFFLSSLIMTKNPILIAALAGILTQSFFANTLFYPFTLVWIILVSAQQIEVNDKQKKSSQKNVRQNKPTQNSPI